MARRKMTLREKAIRLIERYPEAAEMCRNDYSNSYIEKFGHISAATVTSLRKAIALVENHYSNHSARFDYQW